MKPQDLSTLMCQAWHFVKISGITIAEAMRKAWAIYKLKKQMAKGIVKFYYQKVNGTIREAYGTLKAELLPATSTEQKRAKNDTVFTYFDTEVQEYRCFKKLNLVNL